MHPGQAPTDESLVRRLLAAQFPEWADLPIRPVEHYGTDHDIYRLGADLVVRLPRTEWSARQALTESVWLPRLAPVLPLRVPEQVGLGEPAEGFAHVWSVCTWLHGASSAHRAPTDPVRAAHDLAEFVTALRGIDTADAHERRPGWRGGPLAESDDGFRAALTQLGDRIDATAALASWDESLAADVWAEPEVWVHGDLLPGNLIAVDGRLDAVIDWGALNVGDPACDLQPAWSVFGGESRRAYRDALGVDDASWLRGRGWALAQAVIALPYYWETNPGIVRQSAHAVEQVLADGVRR
ncbi:aminoglycoside phosphotransferase family protein [Occultella glacieicola]|uniref:Aminoglycoside phosphotransferase family protein n=2 Tax=Occultella glacieicola TaxID=2518684 RepID=A0ABY2E9W0_9MICO|nr:aminoglycoside phosphotransferase family protein [Occultella glacieicola]